MSIVDRSCVAIGHNHLYTRVYKKPLAVDINFCFFEFRIFFLSFISRAWIGRRRETRDVN